MKPESEPSAQRRAPRGLLVDLDGVVYVGGTPVAGAIEVLERLRRSGIVLRFVTNTSTRPAAAVEEELRSFGLRVEPGDVVSAVGAALARLRELGCLKPYLVVDERAAGEFAELSPVGVYPGTAATSPDWIVVGDIGPRWDYPLLDRLFTMINAGARLLALHKGRFWETEEGLRLDIGAFVAGLEYACGVEAVVTGKPSPDFFRAALARLGLPAEEAAMVGDDIESDVGGAQRVGIRGVLVETGKYREEQVACSGVTPWRRLHSIARLEELFAAGD